MSVLLESVRVERVCDNINNYVRELFACKDHPRKRMTYKTDTNGVVRYFFQCLKCGEKLNPVGKFGVKKMIDEGEIKDEDIGPFDDSILKRRIALQSRIISEASTIRARKENERKRNEYTSYISSSAWKIKRQQVLKRAGGKCEGCGFEPAQEVHHLHYNRFGQEMLFDLVAVCKSCHDKIHPDKR